MTGTNQPDLKLGSLFVPNSVKSQLLQWETHSHDPPADGPGGTLRCISGSPQKQQLVSVCPRPSYLLREAGEVFTTGVCSVSRAGNASSLPHGNLSYNNKTVFSTNIPAVWLFPKFLTASEYDWQHETKLPCSRPGTSPPTSQMLSHTQKMSDKWPKGNKCVFHFFA